jgi:hypothetical protein
VGEADLARLHGLRALCHLIQVLADGDPWQLKRIQSMGLLEPSWSQYVPWSNVAARRENWSSSSSIACRMPIIR